MSQKLLISVVLPIYNPCLFYLKEAISSVIFQTYENIELIISDDTPDDSLSEYMSKNFSDKRIKYYKNNNKKGIFYNLNNAINHSKGEYLQILCQDDILYADCLERQLKTLLKYKDAGFVYSQVNHIDDKGVITSPKHADFGDKTMYRSAHETINLFIKHGCLPGNLSTVMIPRTVLDQVGLFNPKLAYAGDFEYWIRIAEMDYGMAVNYAPLLELRHHNERASFTLGKIIWTEDIIICYSKLLSNNTLKESKFYQKTYINEQVGIQSLKAITRATFKKKTFSFFKLLFRYPLNLFIILILVLITSGGRYPFLKIKSINFDKVK